MDNYTPSAGELAKDRKLCKAQQRIQELEEYAAQLKRDASSVMNDEAAKELSDAKRMLKDQLAYIERQDIIIADLNKEAEERAKRIQELGEKLSMERGLKEEAQASLRSSREAYDDQCLRIQELQGQLRELQAADDRRADGSPARKVVHCATMPVLDSRLRNSVLLTATCDDGTIWQKMGGDEWGPVAGLPPGCEGGE